VIAYSHCISHGFDLRKGLEQQKLAVESGVWPLYRYNPALIAQGKNPLTIDSKEPTIPVSQYAYNETRYRMLLQSNELRAEELMKLAQKDAKGRWDLYRQMAAMHYEEPNGGESKSE
jgi:pyruvate-ferredoxin/flavodoxin oxidoreductase